MIAYHSQSQYIGNGYEALANIKGVNKNAKIYFEKSSALHNPLFFSARTLRMNYLKCFY